MKLLGTTRLNCNLDKRTYNIQMYKLSIYFIIYRKKLYKNIACIAFLCIYY